MSDKKITELPAITGANLNDVDEFVVVDISADQTKSITLAEFKSALDTGSGFVRITGDTMTGNLTVPNVVVSGSVDGRDVSADGTKLDGIAASADVTETTNVTAAGALMDSEVTNLAQVKGFDETDYATSAQGALADSAIQSGDLATVATTGVYLDLTSKPTLGTAAATDSTDYATAAQGTKADTAFSWGNHATAGYTTAAAAEADALALAIALG